MIRIYPLGRPVTWFSTRDLMTTEAALTIEWLVRYGHKVDDKTIPDVGGRVVTPPMHWLSDTAIWTAIAACTRELTLRRLGAATTN